MLESIQYYQVCTLLHSLFESKMNEIIARIENCVSNGVVNYASEIFNEGNLRAPGTPVMVR